MRLKAAKAKKDRKDEKSGEESDGGPLGSSSEEEGHMDSEAGEEHTDVEEAEIWKVRIQVQCNLLAVKTR